MQEKKLGRPPGKSRKPPRRMRQFTLERKQSGDVATIMLLLEKTDYAKLQAAALRDERSTSAQLRWVVKQYLQKEQTP